MFCTTGNGKLLFSWQEDFFFNKRTQHYFNLIMMSWIPEMTMEAACRTSVFLLNYFFKRQTSDHVNGLVENKAVHFGFLESCYISRGWLTFSSSDSTSVVVPLFSYTPSVPKILSGVGVLHRVGFYWAVGMAELWQGPAPPLWNGKERQAVWLPWCRPQSLGSSLRIQWSLLAQRAPSRMSRWVFWLQNTSRGRIPSGLTWR